MRSDILNATDEYRNGIIAAEVCIRMVEHILEKHTPGFTMVELEEEVLKEKEDEIQDKEL